MSFFFRPPVSWLFILFLLGAPWMHGQELSEVDRLATRVQSRLDEVIKLVASGEWVIAEDGNACGELVPKAGQKPRQENQAAVDRINEERRKLFSLTVESAGVAEGNIRKFFVKQESPRLAAGVKEYLARENKPKPKENDNPRPHDKSKSRAVVRVSATALTAVALKDDPEAPDSEMRRFYFHLNTNTGEQGANATLQELKAKLLADAGVPEESISYYRDLLDGAGRAAPHRLKGVSFQSFDDRELKERIFAGAVPRGEWASSILVWIGRERTFVAYSRDASDPQKLEVVDVPITCASLLATANGQHGESFLHRFAKAGYCSIPKLVVGRSSKATELLTQRLTPYLAPMSQLFVEGPRNRGKIRSVYLAGDFNRCFAALAPPAGAGLHASLPKIYRVRGLTEPMAQSAVNDALGKYSGPNRAEHERWLRDPFLWPADNDPAEHSVAKDAAKTLADEVLRIGMNRDSLVCGAMLLDGILAGLGVSDSIERGDLAATKVAYADDPGTAAILREIIKRNAN